MLSEKNFSLVLFRAFRGSKILFPTTFFVKIKFDNCKNLCYYSIYYRNCIIFICCK